MPTPYLWTTLSDEHNRTDMVGHGTESRNCGNGMPTYDYCVVIVYNTKTLVTIFNTNGM